jgi:DNA replication protein DnaC
MPGPSEAPAGSRCSTLVVTSNKPFSGWGEIFGDEVVAAAMIDRLVHHAENLSLKGDSYRPRDKEIATRRRPALIDES